MIENPPYGDEVEYDGVQDTYRTRIEEGENLCFAIVDVVSEALGTDPTALPPLQQVIDTDALGDLFPYDETAHERVPGYVEFEYADCRVTVLGSREVVVNPGWN